MRDVVYFDPERVPAHLDLVTFIKPGHASVFWVEVEWDEANKWFC